MKTTGLAFAAICSLLISGLSIAADNGSTAKKEAPAKAGSNADLVRNAIEELYNKVGNGAPLQYFDLAYIDNNAQPNMPGGIDGLKQTTADLKAAIPDLKYEINDLITADDKVTVRGTISGSNMVSYHGKPPTLQPVKMNVIEIFRVKSGKIAERWGILDESVITNAFGSTNSPSSVMLPARSTGATTMGATSGTTTSGAATTTGAIHRPIHKPFNDSLKVKKPMMKKVESTKTGQKDEKTVKP